MTTLRDTSPWRASRARRVETGITLPNPLYGCTIIALAVFFVGLIAWRVPVEAYIVVSQVGFRTPTRTEAGGRAADEANVFTATRQSLANAIRLADAQVANKTPDGTEPVPDERMVRVEQQLRIQARAVKPGEQSISIAFSGDDPAWSVALVGVLTRDCLLASAQRDEAPAIAARKVRELRWKAELARHYERKARNELELAMEAQSERQASARVAQGGGERDGSDMTASAPEGTVEWHPQWLVLQQELSDMANHLQTLLVTLTPNHPQVQALTQQMEAVRRQLDLTPKYWTPDIAPAVASESEEGPANPEDASQVAHKLDLGSAPTIHTPTTGDEMDATDAARANLDAAAETRESAEDEWTSLIAGTALKTGASTPESRWVITPPTVQGQVGGRPSARRVAAIGGLSLVSGLAFAWGLGSLNGLRRVNSLAELEHLLDLPVVGQLSLEPTGQASTSLAAWGRSLRWLTWMAETTLGLLVVAYLAGVFQSSGVATGLRDDPFATIPQTIVDGMRGWW